MANILMVEDSSFQRKVLKGILTDLGHDVKEADNGFKGLEMIEEVNPDLIFLDLLMPDKDGIEVLTELKENGNEIPIIVLSADIQETIKEKCFELGAAEFIHKPAKKDEVESSIARVLKIEDH